MAFQCFHSPSAAVIDSASVFVGFAETGFLDPTG